MRARWFKFRLLVGLVGAVPHVCFAPDSVTLKIITETGSRVALEDPLTFNAGTILQGLSALGYTDSTPRQERLTTDNRAKPATLEFMTIATWPLLPGLTTKGMVAPGKRAFYYPNIQEPTIIKPQITRTDFQRSQIVPSGVAPPGIRPPSALVDGYAWLRPDKPNLEKPNHVRAEYDYSGPPFIFTMPPEMLKNPLIANDPNLLRLFVKTNESGKRDALAAVNATQHIRRLRSASFWDGVEAPNNPRADYQDGTDYEARARNTTKALADLRDPLLPPVNPNDPRPSYDSRPYYNPQRKR